jgi:hypothetical protein
MLVLKNCLKREDFNGMSLCLNLLLDKKRHQQKFAFSFLRKDKIKGLEQIADEVGDERRQNEIEINQYMLLMDKIIKAGE